MGHLVNPLTVFRGWLSKQALSRPTRNRQRRQRATALAAVESLELRTLLAGAPVDLATTTMREEVSPGAVIERTNNIRPVDQLRTAGLTANDTQLNGQGLQFNLIPMAGMPQFAIDGFQAAANLWSSILKDDIVVNINIGYTALGAGILGQTGSSSLFTSYTSVHNALQADATSLTDKSIAANLQATPDLDLLINRTSDNPNGSGSATPYLDNDGGANNTTINVNAANAKALGLLPAGNAAVDASITFSSSFTWDFDRTDGITSNAFDFIGVAAHEIGHALGFVSGVDILDGNSPPFNGPFGDNQFTFVTPLDLFRFSSQSVAQGPGVIDWTADARSKYFSVDGGQTALTTYSTGTFFGDGRQASHWKDNLNIGIMDPTAAPGEYTDVTNLDVMAFDAVGWNVAMDYGDAPDTGAGTSAGNYATLLADDGPRHYLFQASGNINDPYGSPKVYLGNGVTSDLNGLPNSTATGDTDDGVTFSQLQVGQTATITVKSTANGAKLNYFFDFNGDGDFNDAGEAFAATLTSAPQSLSVDVPLIASSGPIGARFRISTSGNLGPTGAADDGEVEDYLVNVFDPNAGNYPPSDITLTPGSIPENQPTGTAVGTLAAVDPDAGDTHAFFLVNGPGSTDNGQFSIVGNQLIANATFDFEAQSSYSIRVRTTDSTNRSLDKILTVNVTNVNEAPTALALFPGTVSDQRPIGSPCGTFAVSDPDANDTATFSLVSGAGSTDNASFTIVGNQLRTAVVTNLAAKSSYTVRVRATDAGGKFFETPLTVTVTPIQPNRAPVVTPVALAIPENSPVNTVVGKFSASDPDTDQLLTFAITAGNTGGAFLINPQTGVIRVGVPSAINFETTPLLTLTVTATDNGSPALSSSAPVSITVYNVNEPPTLAPQTFNLPENSPAGTLVGTMTGADPDAGTTLTYSISAGNINNAFSINPTTGAITVSNTALLDFEALPTYNLTVTVSDNGNPALSASAAVTVNLTDVNEAPFLGPHAFAVNENSPQGTFVGKVIGVDADAGTVLSYAIVSGNTNNAFALDSATGILTINNPAMFDFETTPQFNLVVSATDDALTPLSATAPVTVTIYNVLEPPVIPPQTLTTAENSPKGTVVGTVAAMITDKAPPTYSILSGNTNNAFAIDAATGQITVNNLAALDFETTPSFMLTVQLSLAFSPPVATTGLVTINLLDVNEAPTIAPQTFTINENVPTNFLVGAVAATDTDAGQKLTYSITSGNTASAFSIDPTSGEIRVNNPAAIDYETNPTFALTVQAADNGSPSLSASATVTVNLANVNDPPVAGPQTFAINENTAAGTVVGTVLATDQDAKQTLTYSITGGNVNDAFALDSATGVLTVKTASALNFEFVPQFSLTVRISDNGNPQLATTIPVTVNLKDVNDLPTFTINTATFVVAENSPVNTFVGQLVASDQDVGQTLTYFIASGDPNGTFTIDNQGVISVLNTAFLDYETNPTFNLTIAARDNGTPTQTGFGTAKITLANVNEPPVVPNQSFAVKINAPVGTTVGTVQASDPEKQPLKFAITAGNGALNNSFAINADTGKITVNNRNAVRSNTTYRLTVRATDSGNPALSSSGTVTIVVNATGAAALQPGAATAVNLPTVRDSAGSPIVVTAPATASTTGSSTATTAAQALPVTAASVNKAKASKTLLDLLKARK